MRVPAASTGFPAARGVFLALPAPFALLAEEGAEHAAGFLGIPQWIWQLANLILFLGLLVYFVARPLATAFRNRQLAVEARLKEARKKRDEAVRFETQMRERMQALEREVDEIRRQGQADGESARAGLEQRAREEAERIRAAAEEEIERRVAAARAQLRQEAARLTSQAAGEIVAREVTPEDRRRLLAESVARLKESR